MKKLSTEIVNERLAYRGITMTGDFVTTATRATFSCESGHQWETTPQNVMRGPSCPHCAGHGSDPNLPRRAAG